MPITTNQPKRGIGENAREQMLRLLKTFEQEVCEEGSGDYLSVTFNTDGGGGSMVASGYAIFNFPSLDTLIEFLEAGLRTRLSLAQYYAAIK